MGRKFISTISLTLAFIFGCSENEKTDVDYLKVIFFGASDTVTNYNKGIGAYYYTYIDFKTDSITYRRLLDYVPREDDSIPPNYYKTYRGVIKNFNDNDTIQKTIELVSKFQNGALKETLNLGGDTYSGAQVYLEVFYKGKEHYIFYLETGAYPQLSEFVECIYNIDKADWKRALVPNNLLNIDSISVEALQKVGLYDSIALRK
jgi:hypothetical protein